MWNTCWAFQVYVNVYRMVLERNRKYRFTVNPLALGPITDSQMRANGLGKAKWCGKLLPL